MIFFSALTTKRKEKMKLFLVKCKSSLLIPEGLPGETETCSRNWLNNIEKGEEWVYAPSLRKRGTD